MEKIKEILVFAMIVFSISAYKVIKNINMNVVAVYVFIAAAIIIGVFAFFALLKCKKLNKQNKSLSVHIKNLNSEIEDLKKRNTKLQKEANFYNLQFAKLNILSKIEESNKENVEKAIEECFEISNSENRKAEDKEVIAKCPICGKNIYEGEKSYYCENQTCSFDLPKQHDILENIDVKTAKKLINGETVIVKNLKKNKNIYSESIKLDDEKRGLCLVSCVK